MKFMVSESLINTNSRVDLTMLSAVCEPVLLVPKPVVSISHPLQGSSVVAPGVEHIDFPTHSSTRLRGKSSVKYRQNEKFPDLSASPLRVYSTLAASSE